MAPPFFRGTRAVQKRTVFGDAPCLKLSVDGYNAEKQTTGRWHEIQKSF